MHQYLTSLTRTEISTRLKLDNIALCHVTITAPLVKYIIYVSNVIVVKSDPNLCEFAGMLQWRKVCFRAKAGEVMRFLCGELCQVNAVGLARITWNTFYTALHFTLHEPTPSERSDNMRKLEFLLANCCPTLRAAMLAAENYRGLTDAFLYKDNETFNLFLEHLNVDQLRHARELVDRVIDRKPSDELRWFRQLLMRRQVTIE